MWSREHFAGLVRPPVVGMVHLLPLPGSPLWGGDLALVREAARADADALVEGGAGALMVENFGDVPFHAGRVGAETVAAMAVVAADLRRRHPDVPLGVNVLRNDAEAALGIAAAVGAAFVRVNVHLGTTATDQGLIGGRADATLRGRRALGVEVGILADVWVKHGRPLVARPLVEEAEELRHRGLADAIILTGSGTGRAADAAELRAVRAALPDCPLLVGSGMTAETVGAFAPWADGYIVGTSLQRPDGAGGRRVAVELVKTFVAAEAAARAGASAGADAGDRTGAAGPAADRRKEAR